jgi:hypothetical protein
MSSTPPVATGQKAATEAHSLVFSLLMGGLAAVSAIAAFLLWWGVDVVRIPIASVTALLLLAVRPIADRFGAWTRVPSARLAAALGFLGLAPLLALGAWALLNEPLVTAELRISGLAEVELAVLAVFAFPLFGIAGAALAMGVANRAGHRVFRLLQIGSRAALGLSVLLLAGAAIRAARRPEPDHYLASLPRVAMIPAVSGEPSAILPPSRDSSASGRADEVRIYEDRIDDLRVRRACVHGQCSVSLDPTDPPAPPDLSRKWITWTVDETTPLALSRDAKHDLWVVGSHHAFRGRDFKLTDIGVDDVADELSPPVGWIAGAALGVALAAGVAFQRRRLQRRLTALAEAKAGVHGRDGWIAFDESLPALRAAPDLGLPEGPVLVVTEQGAGSAGGDYRSGGSLGRAEILPGTREDILAALRGQRAALDAFALTALLLTAAPLLAAWQRGLLI